MALFGKDKPQPLPPHPRPPMAERITPPKPMSEVAASVADHYARMEDSIRSLSDQLRHTTALYEGELERTRILRDEVVALNALLEDYRQRYVAIKTRLEASANIIIEALAAGQEPIRKDPRTEKAPEGLTPGAPISRAPTATEVGMSRQGKVDPLAWREAEHAAENLAAMGFRVEMPGLDHIDVNVPDTLPRGPSPHEP